MSDEPVCVLRLYDTLIRCLNLGFIIDDDYLSYLSRIFKNRADYLILDIVLSHALENGAPEA